MQRSGVTAGYISLSIRLLRCEKQAKGCAVQVGSYPSAAGVYDNDENTLILIVDPFVKTTKWSK
jgi:hypothetical protein